MAVNVFRMQRFVLPTPKLSEAQFREALIAWVELALPPDVVDVKHEPPVASECSLGTLCYVLH